MKNPPSISMRHWKCLVLWFLSQLEIGKHLYHFCLPSLSCTFQEIKSRFCLLDYLRKRFCGWLSSVVIYGSLFLLPWKNTGENPSSNHPSLPTRLLYLTTITGLWPLIHLKCSCWVLFCPLLWCSVHTTPFISLPFSLAALPFPIPHRTFCSTLKVIHRALSVPPCLVESLISEH